MLHFEVLLTYLESIGDNQPLNDVLAFHWKNCDVWKTFLPTIGCWNRSGLYANLLEALKHLSRGRNGLLRSWVNVLEEASAE